MATVCFTDLTEIILEKRLYSIIHRSLFSRCNVAMSHLESDVGETTKRNADDVTSRKLYGRSMFPCFISPIKCVAKSSIMTFKGYHTVAKKNGLLAFTRILFGDNL